MKKPVHGYVPGSTPIFGTYHPPSAPARSVAYAICPPLGWESIQCYHSVRLLGEALARAGFHTLRVAYHGTGESPGSDEDSGRVAAWTASIHQAIDWLSTLDGVSGLGLVGIRMGGTLAARVAADREVASLALWEPCPSGAHYVREMEILASAAPGAVSTTELVATSSIEAGGYVLTRETLTDLARLDLASLKPQGSPHVLLLSRADRPAPTRLAAHLGTWGGTLRVEQPPGFKEMMMYPEASVPSVAGFERITTWALEHSVEVAPRGESGAVYLPARLELEASCRRTMSFGPDQRLFGVMTEPIQEDEHRPAVLFLTGGIVPRTSVNRMYVTLADELAARGHFSLRFDVSGIGESDPAPGHPGRDPYPPALMEDVRAALAVLRRTRSNPSVWLVGLCSGAYAALRCALDDPHVAGLVLLNPLHYRPASSDGRPDTEQPASVGYYRRAASDLERWKRLLSDPSRIGQLLGELARRARRKAISTARSIDPRATTERTVAEDLIALRENGAEVHIVFAAGDPGQAALHSQLGTDIARLGPAGVHVREVDGADHTFNSSRIRNELVDAIIETISASPARAVLA